jgi:hypothetical protein
VSFLFRNAYFFQHVQNGFTLDFKLSGEIIDSNLHSLSSFLQDFPLRDHIDLTAFHWFCTNCCLRFLFACRCGAFIRRFLLALLRLTCWLLLTRGDLCFRRRTLTGR